MTLVDSAIAEEAALFVAGPHRRNCAVQYSETLHRHGKVHPDDVQGPAVNGWSVCRMHGARGGAPSGSANGRSGGGRTQELERMRRTVATFARLTRVVANAGTV